MIAFTSFQCTSKFMCCTLPPYLCVCVSISFALKICHVRMQKCQDILINFKWYLANTSKQLAFALSNSYCLCALRCWCILMHKRIRSLQWTYMHLNSMTAIWLTSQFSFRYFFPHRIEHKVWHNKLILSFFGLLWKYFKSFKRKFFSASPCLFALWYCVIYRCY